MAVALRGDRLSFFKPMDIDARIEELIDAPWQTVKAAAEAVGVQKGDGSWNDMADEIAQAEAALLATEEGEEPTPEAEPEPEPETEAETLPAPTPKVVTKNDHSQSYWAKLGIDYCSNCGEKRAKHSDGSDVICCSNPQWQS